MTDNHNASSHSPTSRRASRPSGAAHPPTVLIVDDEQGILDTYAHYLAPENKDGIIQSARRAPSRPDGAAMTPYRLLLARTGEKAVELVDAEVGAGRDVQVGFFDMKMPGGIDGLETIRRVRAIAPHIYCVIVTAYQDRSLDDIARVFGMESFDHWDYLNKPFSANEIIQKARNATVSWQKRREDEARLRAMDEANRALKVAVAKRTEGLAIATEELKEKRAKLEKAIKEITQMNPSRNRERAANAGTGERGKPSRTPGS